MGSRSALTADEIRRAQDYLNARQRAWWQRQTPEERRERRQRYALNAARKRRALEIKEQGE